MTPTPLKSVDDIADEIIADVRQQGKYGPQFSRMKAWKWHITKALTAERSHSEALRKELDIYKNDTLVAQHAQNMENEVIRLNGVVYDLKAQLHSTEERVRMETLEEILKLLPKHQVFDGAHDNFITGFNDALNQTEQAIRSKIERKP